MFWKLDRVIRLLQVAFLAIALVPRNAAAIDIRRRPVMLGSELKDGFLTITLFNRTKGKVFIRKFDPADVEWEVWLLQDKGGDAPARLETLTGIRFVFTTDRSPRKEYENDLQNLKNTSRLVAIDTMQSYVIKIDMMEKLKPYVKVIKERGAGTQLIFEGRLKKFILKIEGGEPEQFDDFALYNTEYSFGRFIYSGESWAVFGR